MRTGIKTVIVWYLIISVLFLATMFYVGKAGLDQQQILQQIENR